MGCILGEQERGAARARDGRSTSARLIPAGRPDRQDGVVGAQQESRLAKPEANDSELICRKPRESGKVETWRVGCVGCRDAQPLELRDIREMGRDGGGRKARNELWKCRAIGTKPTFVRRMGRNESPCDIIESPRLHQC